MEVLAQLVATLGRPVLLKHVDLEGGGNAAVARWHFGGGAVEVDATDGIRIIMSLSGGETVRWAYAGRAARRYIDAGSVSVASPEEPPRIFVHGSSDVLHVLLAPTLIEAVAERGTYAMVSRLDSVRDRLRIPVSQAFVAATREDVDDGLLLASAVHDLAEQIGSAGPEPDDLASGGLAPAGRRRVEELIADRLDRAPNVSLRLDELARAAGLSRHHFIKSFRHSMGVTPYAYALRRRIQRSMQLLAQPMTSVAEAADRTGFSSSAHFGSCFRRHTGVTPGTFRAAVRN